MFYRGSKESQKLCLTFHYKFCCCERLPALTLAPKSRALPLASAKPAGKQSVLAIGNFFFSSPLPANFSSWRG